MAEQTAEIADPCICPPEGPCLGADHDSGSTVECVACLVLDPEEACMHDPCGDCGHVHTPTGCTGPPTPSDLWAGVSVEGCDCDAADHLYSPGQPSDQPEVLDA